jgi:hypothetical protein
MTTTSNREHDDIPWVNTIVIGMLAGLVGILIYAWAEKSWTVLACTLIVAVASVIAGALTGFIFGIPKTVATASSSTASGTATATSEYQGNSNLEQISDWLTKILVGAGLVQLGSIRDEFNALGSRLDGSGCMGSCGWVVGPSVVIAYVVSGFLIAYLWARIYMANALVGGDGGSNATRAEAGGGDAQATAGPAGSASTSESTTGGSSEGNNGRQDPASSATSIAE